MDLGLNEFQQMLRNSAREFLEAECPVSYVRDMEQDERGYSPELWGSMAEMGWLGLAFPEDFGGEGLGFVELAILLEEMGGALLPGPYFSTVVMAGVALAEAGTEDQKNEYLARIARGQLIVTMAITEPSGLWEPRGIEATATPDRWRVRHQRHQALRAERARVRLRHSRRQDRRWRDRRQPVHSALQRRWVEAVAAHHHRLRPAIRVDIR